MKLTLIKRWAGREIGTKFEVMSAEKLSADSLRHSTLSTIPESLADNLIASGIAKYSRNTKAVNEETTDVDVSPKRKRGRPSKRAADVGSSETTSVDQSERSDT